MSQTQYKGIRKNILLVIILLLPAGFILFLTLGSHTYNFLPYYGPYETQMVEKDGEKIEDTLNHIVPNFSFINQDGEPITEAYLKNKITVVDYFFTTCPSICPIMTGEMKRLQFKLRNDDFNDVQFLSHTVDPETDTVGQLALYAQQMQADLSKWNFVTGTKKALYEQAVYGYFIEAEEDVLSPDGFLHSDMFVLIDKDLHIRGYYRGTDEAEVNKLADDIKILKKEYRVKNRQ